MRIWMDTEFNEFRGDLISMALVAEDGRQWYRALHCENPGPWVKEHVMPLIGIEPVSHTTFAHTLQLWLMQFDSIHIVADWPEDIAHFCNALITGPGMRLNTPPLTMEVRRDLDVFPSAVPHNALEDAQAIRASHIHLETCGPSLTTSEGQKP